MSSAAPELELYNVTAFGVEYAFPVPVVTVANVESVAPLNKVPQQFGNAGVVTASKFSTKVATGMHHQ